MIYPGYEELIRYLKDTYKPTFFGFILFYRDNIATWSLDVTAKVPDTLCSLWLERFRSCYVQVYPKIKSPPPTPKFNRVLWNDVLLEINRRRALMKKYAENSLEVLTASADMATMEAKSLFELEAGSKEPLASATVVAVETDSHEPRSYTPQPQASCATQEPQADASNGQSEDLIHVSPIVDHTAQHTKKLFELARKKFSGDLDEQDREAISTMFTNGDSIEQRLDDYVLELLSRETLTQTETELLKLLLSKIVNLLDSTMQSVIQNLLTPSQLDFVCGQSCTHVLHRGDDLEDTLDLCMIQLMNDIIDNNKDAASLLKRIYLEKSRLIDENEQDSDSYKMLCILNIVVEYFDKRIDDNASELTVYRRFAILLDFLLCDLDLVMMDGETVSSSTRLEMQSNNCDPTTGFGRKIDLLLKVQGSLVEVSSNEWKAKQTSRLAMKQQSKNLRTNASILNQMSLLSKTKLNKVMAIDFVGMFGYMYVLQNVRGFYVAKATSSLFVPKDAKELPLFKNTIKALFKWKAFLEATIDEVNEAVLLDQLETCVHQHVDSPSAFPTPSIFFTPKNTRESKRPFHLVE